MSYNYKTSFNSEPVLTLNNPNHSYFYHEHDSHDKYNSGQFVLNMSHQSLHHSQQYNNPYNTMYQQIGSNILVPSPMLAFPDYLKKPYDTIRKTYDQNYNNFCVRFAVNGISKFTQGNIPPVNNRSIQAGDFGDDAGMIAENSRCIVIGN